MVFPGFDNFEPTAPISYAIFTLMEALPATCKSMTVEFDESGAALVTTCLPDGEAGSDVVLSDDAMSAAGLLLTYLSFQVITMTRMYESEGDDAVIAAQQRLVASLAEFGLSMGYLDETLADTITLTRPI